MQNSALFSSLEHFFDSLLFPVTKQKAIAAALSGGPDSTALVRLLSEWTALKNGPEIHALIVDHQLRPESGQEAKTVQERVKIWPGVKPVILKWEEGRNIKSRKQELARTARYEMFEEYCRSNGISALFLGHHRDDQAETILFRLAKGSGLKGLGGMDPVQSRGSLTILRPFLDTPKADLIAYCKENEIPFVSDPSNKDLSQARPRLRASKDVLAKEGLSDERLTQTARRLRRAEEALSLYADQAYESCLKEEKESRIALNKGFLLALPAESGFRVVCKALEALGKDEDYGPRTSRLEALYEDLIQEPDFRKRTLGGVIISCDNENNCVLFETESGAKTP